MKTMNAEQWQKFVKNTLMFTAPAIAVFFGQLAAGVEPKVAAGVAVLALWGLIADFFKKTSESK